ncbi:hypothetical protein AUJ68_00915 [Candidatus Woesearchaeota archaeon CG1_02_57_44]|nr:MAG: hypothetical protein AUJ68_00915 [Candidatus Woesearchaeota archaeon CG1_02_57_44]
MRNILKGFLEKETWMHGLNKYMVVVGIIIIYLAYTARYFGMQNGLVITILTWSFFVFCTPVADAGFLLDFPIRLLTGMRMIYTEIIVWVIALLVNIGAMLFAPAIYQKTLILSLFYHIITHPWPMWIIILLSVIGTFLSIFLGDELMDVSSHHERKHWHKHHGRLQLVVLLGIIVLILILYDYLLKTLGISIHL